MKKKKYVLPLIIILITILSIHVVSATVNDASMYLSLDQDAAMVTDMTGNGNNGTVINAVYTAAGKVNGAYNFYDTGSTSINVSSSADINSTENITYGGWFKYDNFITGNPIGKHNVTSKTGYNIWYYTTTNSFYCQIGDGSTWPKANVQAGTSSSDTGVWYFVVCVKNGSTTQIYLNGSLSNSASVSYNIGTNTNAFKIGQDASAGGYQFNGTADEVFVYSRALSAPEIAQLYNSGDGYDPYIISSPNFTITALDAFDSSSINNFSATLNGVNYTTTTGTINTNLYTNDTNNYTITIWGANNSQGAYFNKTYYNQSITSALAAQLPQTDITIYPVTVITNETVSGTIYNGSTNTGNTNTSIFFKANTYNLTFVNTTWYNKTQEYTFTALENTTLNLSDVYSTILNVSALNITGGEQIAFIHGNVSTTNYFYPFNLTTPAKNYTEINVLKNLNYTVYLEAENYSANNGANYKNTNITTTNLSLIYHLYRDKSFFVYFKDLLTGTALTIVNYTLIGPTTYTYIGQNETLFRFNLTPSSYNVLVQKTGYTDYSGTLSIANQEIQNVTYYLASNTQNVVVYVRNTYNQYLSNVSVTVIRQSDGSIISSGTTDFSGAMAFDLYPSISYTLNATLDGYQNYSEPFNVIESTYTVTLSSSATTKPSYYQGINYNISPSATTQLMNNTSYDFEFNYTSSYWNITGCWISLTNGNGTTFSTTSGTCTTTSGTASETLNTGDNTTIVVVGILEVDNKNFSYLQGYGVNSIYEGDYSLTHILGETLSFNQGGWGTFGKLILLLLIIVLSVWYVTKDNPEVLNEPEKALWIITIVIGILSVANAITLTWIRIAWLSQYIIFFVVAFFTIAYNIKRFTEVQ